VAQRAGEYPEEDQTVGGSEGREGSL